MFCIVLEILENTLEKLMAHFEFFWYYWEDWCSTGSHQKILAWLWFSNSPVSIIVAVCLKPLKNVLLFWQVKPWVKTSLAPGSGVVTKYLLKRCNIWLQCSLWFHLHEELAKLFLCKRRWTTGNFFGITYHDLTYTTSWNVFILVLMSALSILTLKTGLTWQWLEQVSWSARLQFGWIWLHNLHWELRRTSWRCFWGYCSKRYFLDAVTPIDSLLVLACVMNIVCVCVCVWVYLITEAGSSLYWKCSHPEEMGSHHIAH